VIDSSKLDWHPNTDFDSLLAETVTCYDDHPGYWSDVVVGACLSPHPLAYRAKTVSIPLE
jgi:dTDP-D-glucose 4,6-dehydratase